MSTVIPLDPPYSAIGWGRTRSWRDITCFSYDSDLYIMRFRHSVNNGSREAQYIVAKDYSISFDIDGQRYSITVPRCMLTDLSSTPPGFRQCLGRVGPHLEATIVHDWQYVAWQYYRINPTDDMWRFADDLMHVAMRAAGMRDKARLIHTALRMFGRSSFYKVVPPPLILDPCPLPPCCCRDGEPNTGDAVNNSK